MVHIVGAGPGATDLITVRGARLLGEADVVIYAGSLVSAGMLKLCRKDAEVHVSASLPLDEVLAVSEAAEAAGKPTGRLHTGQRRRSGRSIRCLS